MTYNAEAVERLTRELLQSIGEDPDRPGLQETPRRVAKSYMELFGGLEEDPAIHLRKTFPVDTNDLVLVKNIEFYSMCEHHLLPFFGRAHVAYLPRNGKVTGLSKLARCVEGYSRRPQVQERMTRQVADALVRELDVIGAAVIIEARHMCMTMRGIKKLNSETVTTAFTGDLDTPQARQEILSLTVSP